MTCRVYTGDGFRAIVCGPQPRARRCVHCKAIANLLCDFVIADNGATCDAPICARCTTPMGKDLDYCRDHAPTP